MDTTSGPPASDEQVDRIRLAAERSPNPEAALRELQTMVADANDWTVDQVLHQLKIAASAVPSADEAAGARTRRVGFEFTKSVKYGNDGWTMSFDRDSATLDAVEQGKPAYLVTDENLQVPIVVRGYRSEDEAPSVARTRAEAVVRSLRAAGFGSDATIDATSEGTKGNFDYREMRRVEVRLADEAKPAALEDGRVLGTDARYAGYGIKASLDGGKRLIETALGKLASITNATPPADPAMKTFRKFFTTADPAVVASNLRKTSAQIEHYRPEAPADASAPEGGHACLDKSRPGLLYLNQGVGAEARMIAGVLSLDATAGARAYNIVHEATHGAPGLETLDFAYEWQRLFPFLSPELQLKNADSYAMLVGVLNGLTQATPEMSEEEAKAYDIPAASDGVVDSAGLQPDMRRAVSETWAWLQHYTTQLYLNFRDLYPNIAAGHPLAAGSYQAKLWGVAASAFGLRPGEYASIAGIIDRLDDLNSSANKTKPYYFATQPPQHPGGEFDAIILPAQLPSDLPTVMHWQLDLALDAATTIAPALKPHYKNLFIQAVPISNWGGPLG